MPRSIWNGTITFGMVNVPVKLYTATESKTVHFHEVHVKDGAKIEHRRICPKEDKEIPYDDIVKGFEVSEGKYVVLDKDEIKAAAGDRGKVVHIEEFVDATEIDPVFFEKAYYAVPARGAEKPYLLLLRALHEAGRVGIGRFVLRTKPHLVALRSLGDVLALETLFFGDEVRDPGDLVRGVASAPITDRELDVAKQLIGALATEWEPANYADEYREELLRIIAERTPARVEEAETSPAAESKVEELLDALKRSVEDARARRDHTAEGETGEGRG
jgi:DNA end-binding protein Ku